MNSALRKSFLKQEVPESTWTLWNQAFDLLDVDGNSVGFGTFRTYIYIHIYIYIFFLHLYIYIFIYIFALIGKICSQGFTRGASRGKDLLTMKKLVSSNQVPLDVCRFLRKAIVDDTVGEEGGFSKAAFLRKMVEICGFRCRAFS